MPKSPKFLRVEPGRASSAVCRAVLSIALLAIAGCSSVNQTAMRVPPEEKLLPSPEINPDLIKTIEPSNQRDWSADQAVLPWAEFHGEKVTVHNIRNCTYRSLDDYDVHYYDKTYDLGKLTSVDFIVVPFNDSPGIAHTMLSFGFEDRDYLGLSVEIRKERGESYHAMKGFFNQYEMMYVLADEHDLILKNTVHNHANVYVYRTVARPEQARALLLDVLERTNKLTVDPEFYSTLTNNCTTNIRGHINNIWPNRIPYDYRVLLPGYAPELAYELGLLRSEGTFEATRREARVNYEAYLHRNSASFSQLIRR